MLVHVSKSEDMNKALEEANKFLSTLKFGQWYSTQMNPLLAATSNIEVKHEGTKTTDNTHRYEWIVVTYYLDEYELAQLNKKQGNLLSG